MIRTKGQKIFNVCNVILMVLLSIGMLYPFWYTIIYSINNGDDSIKGALYFWPRDFTLSNYVMLFKAQNIVGAYMVSIARSIIGPITAVLFTALVAYAMSYRDLLFKKTYNILFLIPMFFGGGLIPTYLLITNLGLKDNFLVYIIPGLFGIWDFVMLRTYMHSIPASLEESAKMDGANEIIIFFKIMLPMCMPIIACLLLFGSVGHWNAWFDAYIYNDNPNLFTIQLVLKNVIAQTKSVEQLIEFKAQAGGTISANQMNMMMNQVKRSGVTNASIQAAASIITIGPIIFLYPFMQRYFIKGVIVGSVKG